MFDRRAAVIWTLGSLLTVGVGVAAGVTKGPVSGGLFALAGLVPGVIAVAVDIYLKKRARAEREKKLLAPFKPPAPTIKARTVKKDPTWLTRHENAAAR